MADIRKVEGVFRARPTLEGAGVRLKRAFGFHDVPVFDPFLMLDDFHSHDPADYLPGFPWHPHRGIETITYLIQGQVEHGDSMGNSGVIREGEVQWMTAGSGIIHQEMPRPAGESGGTGGDTRLWGMQLWANLPAAQKMMQPRYRGLTADYIPVVTTAEGAEVRIISGEVDGVSGPVADIVIEPEYFDVTIPAGAGFRREVDPEHKVFAYGLEGTGWFGDDKSQVSRPEEASLFGEGDLVTATAGSEGLRFIFLTGKPLNEPIAWGGPIVMNTQEELEQAFRDYAGGTFIRERAAE